MLDTISTAKMSREEWLEERRKSIGGSDVAAVIGMSRFASPYTVWLDKTGRIPDKGDTEAMRRLARLGCVWISGVGFALCIVAGCAHAAEIAAVLGGVSLTAFLTGVFLWD